MKAQRSNTSAAPETMLVSILGEIIAPVAHALAAIISRSLDYAIAWHARRRGKRTMQARTGPAPHVALVMVPGNFVTEPFLRR